MRPSTSTIKTQAVLNRGSAPGAGPRPIVKETPQDATMLEWVKRGRLPGIRPSYKKAVVARTTAKAKQQRRLFVRKDPELTEEQRLRKRAEFMAELDKILPNVPSFRIDEIGEYARRSRTYVFDAISQGRLIVHDGRAARSEFKNFLATECGL